MIPKTDEVIIGLCDINTKIKDSVLKFVCFPTFRLLAYLMKLILETSSAH